MIAGGAAEPRALYDARARGDIDVNNVPDLNKAPATPQPRRRQ
jgi:hypothetical protein